MRAGLDAHLSDIRPRYCARLRATFGQHSNCHGVSQLDLIHPDFDRAHATLLGRFRTVFALNANGVGFANLHSFTAPANDSFGFYTNTDGAHPLAGLLLSGGILYGSANNGGTSGHGTVFAVNTDGLGFATLHSFSSGSGGAYSSAGLILLGNTLYGTDYGNLGNGTVFAINTDGTVFTNYYAFTSAHLNDSGILTNSDGANPYAGLIFADNTLYGTATGGGSSGNGTVFSLSFAPQLTITSSGTNVILTLCFIKARSTHELESGFSVISVTSC